MAAGKLRRPNTCCGCSGSWLEVIAKLAAGLQVPHRIVAAGALLRAPGQERIAFLAAARNAALAPLWDGDPAAAAERHFRLLKGQVSCVQ